jgi:hypothetical protein
MTVNGSYTHKEKEEELKEGERERKINVIPPYNHRNHD